MRRLYRTATWAAMIAALTVGFLVSMILYPVVASFVGVVGLLVLTNVSGARARITGTRVWRWLPLVGRTSPILAGLALVSWAALSSGAGYAMYSSGAGQVAKDHARATQTAFVALATAQAASTETARVRIARADATSTSVAQHTALVRARARRTAVVRAHALATAETKRTAIARIKRAIAARAMATARAIQRARAQAAARAHATAVTLQRIHMQATAQAVAQAHAQQTAQSAAAATAAVQPSGDTYADVNDHPDLHQGEYIEWTCNIAKFLGDDPNAPGNTDIGCLEFTGTFDGSGDGEIILNVPATVDTDTMHSGDDLRVYGKVEQPWEGQNGFGATMTWPQIDVKSLTDLGRDPNASS